MLCMKMFWFYNSSDNCNKPSITPGNKDWWMSELWKITWNLNSNNS